MIVVSRFLLDETNAAAELAASEVVKTLLERELVGMETVLVDVVTKAEWAKMKAVVRVNRSRASASRASGRTRQSRPSWSSPNSSSSTLVAADLGTL